MTPGEAFAVFDASMRAQGLETPARCRQAVHDVAEAAVAAERTARIEAERELAKLRPVYARALRRVEEGHCVFCTYDTAVDVRHDEWCPLAPPAPSWRGG